MVRSEEELRDQVLELVAQKMAVAARTAPKACGVDNLTIKVVTGQDIARLSVRMRELSVTLGKQFFARDADNVQKASAVLLVGTKYKVQGLNCGLCGFDTCAEKDRAGVKIPCVFNTHDLGLAIGSAVSIAADNRADNRVMYSLGVAAMDMGLMSGCDAVISVPIASLGKSPFFDRKAL